MSGILESYSRSPFLATDNDNFLDAGEKVDNQGDVAFQILMFFSVAYRVTNFFFLCFTGENRRLDTISEGGLSYDDFGSE